MKTSYKFSLSLVLSLFFLMGCIEQFSEFKEDNEALTTEDVSARFFFPNVQTGLWMPPSWNYLFTHGMWGPAYGGYASFGYKNSWEQPDVLFNTTRSWGASSTAWNYYSSYFLKIDGFLRLVEPGGTLENNLMEAVGNIMKATYYSTYTDLWGEIPFSEVGQEGVLTPKFDEQKVIYEGIIDNLDEAMAVIGDNSATGTGTNDLAEFDILFGGDLQRWKEFANAMKLRVALRAKGAPGEDFADAAINEALAAPLPNADIEIPLDLGVNWSVAARDGDFTRFAGSWSQLSDRFVNALQDNNDPRLPAYADPIPGGEIVFGNYTDPSNKIKIDYLLTNTLDRAGVSYTTTEGTDLTVAIAPGEHYVGMPMRFIDGMKTFLHDEMFSRRDRLVRGTPEAEVDQLIMPLAEIYFMQAEAAVLGFGGDASSLFQMGIQASFDQWEVTDNGYLSSAIATLSGSTEEQLQQIGFQAYLAYYNVDFQGFAIARDFNLQGITDDLPNRPELFSLGLKLGTKFPGRVIYAQTAYDLNGENLTQAVSRQGPDTPATKLWFTKGTKNN